MKNIFRVALVALHFSEYSLNLALALARNNKVLLVLSEENARAEIAAERLVDSPNLQIALVETARSFSGVFSCAKEISSIVRQFKPNILHCQEAIQIGLLLAMFRLRGYPLAVTSHDPTPHSGDEVWSLSTFRRLAALRFWRSQADVLLTHGEVLAAQLLTAYPKSAGRIFSVPHGPLGGLRSTDQSVSGNFLFFGRVQKYKGLVFFMEAIERLHAEGLEVKGVIAGRGPDLEPYRSRVSAHPAFELNERFIREEELPGFFGRAQAVVLPYTDGTQSGVAAMALGYGRAVVSTRVGSVQEMVRDGDNGILVPPCDVNALTNALRRIIKEPATAYAMGERSYALGQGELSWARNAEISGQAYAKALSLRAR
ncbi:glycosyltransferase family 4 protein [Roseateles sp. PN1]|uniref:glycosyltransferase family 4 protein n=1 Tax=Roseateles sp. PN1 TaxID=3137372 RepID=UPI003139A59F